MTARDDATIARANLMKVIQLQKEKRTLELELKAFRGDGPSPAEMELAKVAAREVAAQEKLAILQYELSTTKEALESSQREMASLSKAGDEAAAARVASLEKTLAEAHAALAEREAALATAVAAGIASADAADAAKAELAAVRVQPEAAAEPAGDLLSLAA